MNHSQGQKKRWKKVPKSERRIIMSGVATKRWEKSSKEDRIAVNKMLLRAREKVRNCG